MRVGASSMVSATTEQKLELVQQIRNKYNQDQFDLGHREEILYGKTIAKDKEYYEPKQETYELNASGAGFRIRLFVAFLLFVLIILFDITGKSLFGMNTPQIFQAIEANYENRIDSWVEAMSNTTK